jgi:spermidine synthase
MTVLPAVATGSPASRLLPFVLLLFAAGGCAALIYEIVWYQMLQLAIGSSAVSLGILLATFMGGLCIGSLALGRLRRGAVHPLLLYSLIELGIGICGLLVLWGLPLFDQVYISGLQSGLPGMLLRGLICAVCLLAPTILMGASLPAISRFVEATPRGVTWWGWLYAGNTLGAVSGCLLAAFYLMRLHDMAFTTYAAAAINLVIAVGGFALARLAPDSAVVPTGAEAAPSSAPAEEPVWPVYLTIAISGATALGAEVVWTRQLAMMFDGTIYAFSIILAVFLVGLGLGSVTAASLLRFLRPRATLGWSQILLVVGIAWAAYMINLDLPFRPAMLDGNGWQMAYVSLLRTAEALLPATLMWGASFPLAMAAAAGTKGDPARPVGKVYAANTLGGVAGALSVSLILIAWIGTRDTQRLMLVLAGLGGLLLLVPPAWRTRGTWPIIAITEAVAAVAVLVWLVPAQPGNLVAYGRLLSLQSPYSTLLEVQEGRNSSLAITRWQDGSLQISVAGHVEATNIPYDMRLQRMVGHLPALLHPNPVKILGIGFGAGVSAGSFTGYPSVKSITICEMEPKVPPTSTKYFASYDNDVYHDPRTHIIYDDGRHYLITTKEKFDIIASDPLDVWVKGTATIYSSDYFEKVKEHLNPDGYFTLYVPLYESDEVTVKSEIATFFKVFPNGTIWANTIDGRGYDLVLMGQEAPLKIDLDAVDIKLRLSPYAKVRQSMAQIGFDSAIDMYSTFIGQRSDLSVWLKDAQINTDSNLRLMYLAGWGINAKLEDPLYRKIVQFRHTPTNIFAGSDERKNELYAQMEEGEEDQ